MPAEALEARRKAALEAANAAKDREAGSTVDVLMALRADLLAAAADAGLDAGTVEVLFQVRFQSPDSAVEPLVSDTLHSSSHAEYRDKQR